jgi:hypothetical protein
MLSIYGLMEAFATYIMCDIQHNAGELFRQQTLANIADEALGTTALPPARICENFRDACHIGA